MSDAKLHPARRVFADRHTHVLFITALAAPLRAIDRERWLCFMIWRMSLIVVQNRSFQAHDNNSDYSSVAQSAVPARFTHFPQTKCKSATGLKSQPLVGS
jgi:hypothetical protein